MKRLYEAKKKARMILAVGGGIEEELGGGAPVTAGGYVASLSLSLRFSLSLSLALSLSLP